MLLAPGGVAHAVAFFEIPSGTKSAGARAGEDDRAGVARIHGNRFKGRYQIQSHLRVEGICSLGPVQCDLQHMWNWLAQQQRFIGCHIMSHLLLEWWAKASIVASKSY